MDIIIFFFFLGTTRQVRQGKYTTCNVMRMSTTVQVEKKKCSPGSTNI